MPPLGNIEAAVGTFSTSRRRATIGSFQPGMKRSDRNCGLIQVTSSTLNSGVNPCGINYLALYATSPGLAAGFTLPPTITEYTPFSARKYAIAPPVVILPTATLGQYRKGGSAHPRTHAIWIEVEERLDAAGACSRSNVERIRRIGAETRKGCYRSAVSERRPAAEPEDEGLEGA